MRRWALAIVTLSWFVTVVGAWAAEISETPDLRARLDSLRPVYTATPFRSFSYVENSGKVVTLEGKIEKGDAAKLATLLDPKTIEQNGYKGAANAIILESPGGDLLEGIRIGQLLRKALSVPDSYLQGVYVLNGTQCNSACALAFAMAVPAGQSNPDWSRRYIETGARVGFHMGIVPDEKNEQFRRLSAAKALTLGYEIVEAITEVVRAGSSPVQLLEETLKQRKANEFFQLRGGVRSHFMGFAPVDAGVLSKPLNAAALTADNLDKICISLMPRSRLGLDALTLSDAYYANFLKNWGQPHEASASKLLEAAKGSLAIAYVNGPVCNIRRDDNGVMRMKVFYPNNARYCGDAFKSWCADSSGPQGTILTVAHLADAWGCSGGKLVRKFDSWLGDHDPAYRKTDLAEPNNWVRSVSREVSMRKSPGLKAARIGKLPKEAQVRVNGCALSDGSQGLWMKVTHKGKTGWVSARFLSALDHFAMLRPAYSEVVKR